MSILWMCIGIMLGVAAASDDYGKIAKESAKALDAQVIRLHEAKRLLSRGFNSSDNRASNLGFVTINEVTREIEQIQKKLRKEN